MTQKSDYLRNWLARPSADSVSARDVYHAAKQYVKGGLSLIPIRANGSKMPAFEALPEEYCPEQDRQVRRWSPYRERLPSRQELREWFAGDDDERGMAILGGPISGNLEIVDLDNIDIVIPWARQVEQVAPGLLRKLPMVRTPRPGLHVYYRTQQAGGNQKLARVPDPDHAGKKPKTIIELKATSGYCLAPPSPASCHPTGRLYTVVSDRDLSEVPVITTKQRNILVGCAKMLDRWDDPKPPPPRRIAGRSGDRPGDDYNLRAEWADILTPHGWTPAGRGADGSQHWCRPDKPFGTSATSSFSGTDLLYVFSSNAAPFDEWKAYSKFHAYALLEHDGDFNAAARALVRRGFGKEVKRRKKLAHPYDRYRRYAAKRQ